MSSLFSIALPQRNSICDRNVKEDAGQILPSKFLFENKLSKVYPIFQLYAHPISKVKSLYKKCAHSFFRIYTFGKLAPSFPHIVVVSKMRRKREGKIFIIFNHLDAGITPWINTSWVVQLDQSPEEASACRAVASCGHTKSYSESNATPVLG